MNAHVTSIKLKEAIKEQNFPTSNDKPLEGSLKELKKLLSTWNQVNTDVFFNSLRKETVLKKISDFHFDEISNSHQSNIEIIPFGEEDKNLTIHYFNYATFLGEVLIASTRKGICYFAFESSEKPALPYLKKTYPKTNVINKKEAFHELAINYLESKTDSNHLPLHIKGTAFQFEVWNALLKIPIGSLTSYAAIANTINRPKAFRAVGTAIGNNPISFFIPCHRVIQSSGNFGGYMWGLPTKSLLIGWESTQLI